MKKTSIILWAIIAVVLIGVLYIWSSYNNLVTLNEGVSTAWSQVETQYQRRLDLIPNLVESVKGVMKQETSVFTALADARTKYGGATNVNDKVKAGNEIETALGRLLVVMEAYPQLKSSETVQTLMSQLEGAENRVSVKRERFNENIRVYNLAVKRFPGSMVAGIFGFADRPYFESVKGAETAPSVKF